MEEIIPPTLKQNLVNTHLAVKSLINDIKTYDGSVEELKKLNEIGRLKLSNLRKYIDDLETYAKEQTNQSMKNEIMQHVSLQKEQLQSSLKDFQKANVECVLSIEKKSTEELFAMSDPEEVLRKRNNRNHSSLLHENSEITDHMSSISRRLAEVIAESSGALETLVRSSTNITGIRDELRSTGSIIDQSGKILNKYQQREFTDKILIIFAFAFFMACVFYVVYCRI
ncbi:vesicle transport protein SEC20 [Planococcus citri]|uniref:vesicle transport protein SEC20 n=1 Tax=Planococcus citri TaxID=170843 RepID=UPI0031F8616F